MIFFLEWFKSNDLNQITLVTTLTDCKRPPCAAPQTSRNWLSAVSHEKGLRIQFNKTLMSIWKRKIPQFWADMKCGFYITSDANTHKVYAYLTEKKPKYPAIRIVF